MIQIKIFSNHFIIILLVPEGKVPRKKMETFNSRECIRHTKLFLILRANLQSQLCELCLLQGQ